jgi:hypothetical protein
MNVSEIMSTIKKATAFDIFLISFFALPFVFSAWIEVFTKVGWKAVQIYWSLVILFALYVLAVIVLIVDNNNKKRKEIAKDLILGYLQGKGYKMMSFNRIRQELNPTYNDEFLEKLIQEFPKVIRRTKLKGDKPGVGRIIVEATDDEEAEISLTK